MDSVSRQAKELVRPVWRWLRTLTSKKLDPMTVSQTDAGNFFRRERRANRRAVAILAPYLQRSQCIFDVGANCGFFSAEILAAHPAFQGTLVLFEPIPHLLAIAIETLSSHPGVNKVFVNSALGESSGTIMLFLPDNSNLGWITAVKEKTQDQPAVQAAVARTEDYIRLFRPDTVKIDVEGYELFVLRPFLKFIDRDYRPVFLAELGWGVSNPNWPGFMECAKLLVGKGYCFRSVEGETISLESLERLRATTDVLIAPRE